VDFAGTHFSRAILTKKTTGSTLPEPFIETFPLFGFHPDVEQESSI